MNALRPSVILPILAGVVVVVALVTPEQVGSSEGRAGLSTYSTAAGGDRIFFELAARFGARVERRLSPLDSLPDSAGVQVVLAPKEPLGAREVHRLLDGVRRGGGLIVAVADDDDMADSLHVTGGRVGRLVPPDAAVGCGAAHDEATSWLAPPPIVPAIRWRRPPPSVPATLAVIDDRDRGELPAALGITLGRGRIALASDAQIFRNDVMRVCRWETDLVAAKLLAYAEAGDARRIVVFDEYHHGYGMHPGSLRAVVAYLAGTSSGHLLLQALAAGMVLLLAAAPRPVPPTDVKRVARRSPLEHADALAHAYAEVGATRTATARLVDGLRRRTALVVPGVGDADSFLNHVETTRRTLATDVATVRRALHERIAARELPAVGDALEQIEQALMARPSR